MKPFTWHACRTLDEALEHVAEGAAVIAGGTNLVDLMKTGAAAPQALVPVQRLPLERIEEDGKGGMHLGATATNAATAWHPLVKRHFPLVSAAILAGASPQIRNAATNGGNLLQRTRCHYFYDTAMPCNKREPDTGCSAVGGLTRQHAILGASPECIATHPSDLCVALAALDAVVHVRSSQGSRQIAFVNFHRLPGDHPELDNTLDRDEIITHISLPEASRFSGHSAYLKFRDRASYAFALVSVAAAIELGADGLVTDVRVALGGVAHKPWRLRAAELTIIGEAPTDASFDKLAQALTDGARSQGENAFKIPMARRAVVRALQRALAGTVDNAHEEPQ